MPSAVLFIPYGVCTSCSRGFHLSWCFSKIPSVASLLLFCSHKSSWSLALGGKYEAMAASEARRLSRANQIPLSPIWLETSERCCCCCCCCRLCDKRWRREAPNKNMKRKQSTMLSRREKKERKKKKKEKIITRIIRTIAGLMQPALCIQ